MGGPLYPYPSTPSPPRPTPSSRFLTRRRRRRNLFIIYIYKGYDAGDIQNETSAIDDEEIGTYTETRYVRPVEVCWRILSKLLQDKSHSIMRLPVHLSNQKSSTIVDEGNDEAIGIAFEKITMLLEYFSLDDRDADARQYVYGEISCHYLFKKEKGLNVFRWEKHKAHFNVIGQMYSISPTQTKLFHLRLLLLTVKGAKKTITILNSGDTYRNV